MTKTTHKTEHRLLAGFMALSCMFLFVFGNMTYADEEYADETASGIENIYEDEDASDDTGTDGEYGVMPLANELPINVSLTLVDNDNASALEPDHTYAIDGEKQYVNMKLLFNYSGTYEENQILVKIPINAFHDRDENSYKMVSDAYTALLSQLSPETVNLLDDGKESGYIVFGNKSSVSAPQLSLSLTYEITALSVKDEETQSFTVEVTDTNSQDDYSQTVTPTFETHVNRISLSKSVADTYAPKGCYYEWDDSLDKMFKLSEQGIDEDAFTSLCNDYYFVTYKLESYASKTDVNQKSVIYVDESPVGGETVAVSYQSIGSGHGILYHPLEKMTDGEFNGQWKCDNWEYNRTSSAFYVLAQYPKNGSYDMEINSETGTESPRFTNNAEVTYVGVDNDGAKRTSDTDSTNSVWQEAAAGDMGDIWGVFKEGYADPVGAVNILRNGGDVTFSYDITGVGKTYKYIADKDYETANGNDYSKFGGPYYMEVVDDAMYVNGLGADGTEIARLQPDDFYFKTFTMQVKHDIVNSVDLNGDVRDKTSKPIQDRTPIEVYVMTEGSSEWEYDQTIASIPYNGSSTTYGHDDDNVFEFVKDKVYRVKFVYKNANGDIQLDSTLTGVLRSEGQTVKRVLANLEQNSDLNNFQLFNWDAEMGYNSKDVWQDPKHKDTIKNPTPDAMKNDLLALDAGLYDGHGTDRIANRQVAYNNLSEASFFSGAAKKGELEEADGKVKGNYVIAAVTGGGAVSEDNLRELVDLKVLPECKEIVFYELLPIGMKIKNVKSMAEKDSINWEDFRNSGYTWDNFSYYAGDIHPLHKDNIPEISWKAEENYKGTMRQMVKITAKYKDLPIVEMGFGSIGGYRYAFGDVMYVETEAAYGDLISQTLTNNMTAQFCINGVPFELDGTAVYPDDGSVFDNVLDENGNHVFNDIDSDTNTEEKTVVGAENSVTWETVTSFTQLIKKIKADDFDDDFKDFTQTYAGHNYTYRIYFQTMGDGLAKNLIIFDSIEEAVRSESNEEYYGKPDWKGSLYGVDLQEARNAGFNDIKVYVNTIKYYTNKELATNYDTGYAGLTPDDLTEDKGWSVIDPDNYSDWDKVKTIAFAFGEDKIFGSDDNNDGYPRSVTVYLKMTAPKNIYDIHKEQEESEQILAYNQPAYYSEKGGRNDKWDPDTTVANVVTIGLKSAVKDIPSIKKTFKGYKLPKDFKEECVFLITPLNDAPAPAEYNNGEWGKTLENVKVTARSEMSEIITSANGSLFFTEPGVYEYEISEQTGDNKDVTYSKAKYKVVYTVTDEREIDGEAPQYAEKTQLDVGVNIFKTHDENGIELEKPEEKNSIEFTNIYDRIEDITISKVAVGGEKELDGATLSLYKAEDIDKNGAPKNGAKPIETWISGNKPHTVEAELTVGETYVLVEMSAPDGYAYAASIEFTLEEDGTLTVDGEAADKNTVIMEDKAIDDVNISKVDMTSGKEIAGATLTITDSEGNVIETWVTEENKTHTVDGSKFKAGETYTLTETGAPDGYAYAEEIKFTIGMDGSVNGGDDRTIVMKDKAIDDVNISKVDMTSEKEIAGATLTITDSEGNVIETWTTEENKTHTIDGRKFKVGETYTLTETGAPDGYAYAEEIKFTIGMDGSVNGGDDRTIVMKDKAIDDVNISKIDMTSGKEIAGATLTITDSEGNVIETWVTEENKTHTVDGSKFKAGETYTLTETSAPNGYDYAEEIKFTIGMDGSVNGGDDRTIVMKDERLKVNDTPSDDTPSGNTTPSIPGNKNGTNTTPEKAEGEDIGTGAAMTENNGIAYDRNTDTIVVTSVLILGTAICVLNVFRKRRNNK